jgi:peptidoglycan/LPS O-acetylase OafA/YrhL
MKEIRALTGIRGIAAVTVFLDHTHAALDTRGVSIPVPEVVHRLFLQAGRQVDVFFLLSGFILALIYANWFKAGVQRDAYFNFLRRRFARIYPLHLFIVLLVLSFVLAAQFAHMHLLNGLDRFDLWTLPATLLLVHGWGFLKDGGPWNPPSWSISIEAMAYMLLPAFLWVTARQRKENPWLVVFLAICCGFTLNAFFNFAGPTGIDTIVRGLSEFAFGCTLPGLMDTRFGSWLRSTSGCTVAFVGLLVGYALTPDIGFIIVVCAAPVLLALCGSNWLSGFMGCTPVYFLGEISYSIYLGHFLYTSLSYRLVNATWMQSSPAATAAGILEIVAVVIGLSTLTYYAIERPGRDWLSGKRKQVLEEKAAAA